MIVNVNVIEYSNNLFLFMSKESNNCKI